MFKQFVLAVATLAATMGLAMAQVDVNKADQAALDSVNGIGPKSAVKLSEAGLQINGQGKGGAAKPAAKVAEKK